MSCVAAVRTLCEFTARAGDLDLRFTPAPTGQEGVAGHGVVTGRRGPGYETEIALSGEYGELLVRGRADGYDPAAKRLEEIKTYRGRLDSVRENHRAAHWAQAKVYGHLLCQARGLPGLTVALVYFNVATEEETMLAETHPAAELEALQRALRALPGLGAAGAGAPARRARRGAGGIALPHEFAAASASWRWPPTASARWRLPAGAGADRHRQNAGHLVSAAAAPEAGLDKLFFLAAKGRAGAGAAGAGHAERAAGRARPAGAGAAGARQALRASGQGLSWRVLPVGAIRPLPRARAGALAHGRMDAAALRQVAAARRLPYYLAQELTRWSDVVVGDYNYYYDATAMLHALTQASQWKVAVLADEAHNLVDRARRMYTAELSQATLAGARQAAPAAEEGAGRVALLLAGLQPQAGGAYSGL